MQLLLSLQHMTDLRKRVTLNRHRNVLQVTAPVVLYVDAYKKKKTVAWQVQSSQKMLHH